MLTPRQKYEVCRVKSGTALIPFFDTVTIDNWRFSTRHGNAKVKWGDGTETDYVLAKNIDLTSGGTGTSMPHAYATPYTGDVEVIFKQGLRDVYSLNVVYWSKGLNNGLNEQRNKINIQDFGTYIKKFSNLYSYLIDTYSYNTPIAQPIIKGDLADIPASVERISIGNLEVVNSSTGDVYFNFNSLVANSKLKYFFFSAGYGSAQSNLKLLGNIGNLPVGCSFFKTQKVTSNSAITYTAGKVWASSFDTLSIPLPLTTPELDNLLIDMDNSITTKIGEGVIALGGYRSPVSDSAVASLVAKGFTVNFEYNIRLSMPLSADLLDTSPFLNHATMVGTANYTGGALNTSTGNYAYIPNKTSLDFGTGSLYFGCKIKFNTAPTSTKGLMGKTIAAGISGRFGLLINSAGNITALTELGSAIQNSTPAGVYADGNFHSIEAICDRTTGQQKLYIDGVLINTTNFTPSNNNITANARFNIGAYGNATGNGILASSEFNGAIKDVFVHKF